MTKNKMSLLAGAGALCLALSACGSSGGGGTPSDGATDGSAPSTTTGTNEATGGATTSAGAAGCYLQLYDGDNFEDTNFKLDQPGSYSDLKDLPGANQDWTDEADSAKVGSAATVTIYADPDFKGKSVKLEPGSDHARLDPEPSSLKMSC